MSMRTYTGKVFDPVDPKPEMISIVDIGQGLSMQARFCGQVREFYSVAEHSVVVARLLKDHFGRPDLAIYGLLHDAHEAYISDIPSPVKKLLEPAIAEVEHRIDLAIWNKFDLPEPTEEQRKIIRQADQTAFLLEDRDLRSGVIFHDNPLPDITIKPIGQQQAKITFIEMFLELTSGQNR